MRPFRPTLFMPPIPPASPVLALALALSLSTAAAPVSAQEQKIGWLDVLTFENIVTSVMGFGIATARTQVDLTYDSISVSTNTGRVALNDLRLWPLPPWDTDAACEIAVDRISLQGAPIDVLENARLKVDLFGLRAPAVCLPPEARPVLQMAGVTAVDVPHLEIDMTYDLPSGAVTAHVHAVAAEMANLDLIANLSYFSMDARNNPDEPEPVIFFDNATLSIENLGGWDKLQGLLPGAFTNPETAPLALEGALGMALASLNRESAPAGDSGSGSGSGSGSDTDPSKLSDAQLAFIASAKAVWPAFLNAPQRIVLETEDRADNIFLDFNLYERDPRAAFEDFRPRFALAPAASINVMPAQMLNAALSENADGLSPADKRAAGLALISGRGAPRNVPAGVRLLTASITNGPTPALAEADIPAGLALSEALELRAPEAAYGWALRAGASGGKGALARADRLERLMPMEAILRNQQNLLPDGQIPSVTLNSIASIRAQARARLTGRGETRAYARAAMWAMIGAAAGDPECAAILDEIDEKIRFTTPEDQAVWASAEENASALATEAWLQFDMPKRLKGEN